MRNDLLQPGTYHPKRIPYLSKNPILILHICQVQQYFLHLQSGNSTSPLIFSPSSSSAYLCSVIIWIQVPTATPLIPPLQRPHPLPSCPPSASPPTHIDTNIYRQTNRKRCSVPDISFMRWFTRWRLTRDCSTLFLIERCYVHRICRIRPTDNGDGIVRRERSFAGLLVGAAVEIGLGGACPDGEVADVGGVVNCTLGTVIFICVSISFAIQVLGWKRAISRTEA